jgi:hypothetical protein
MECGSGDNRVVGMEGEMVIVKVLVVGNRRLAAAV